MKLFRSIRKKLLEENKTSKYLRYAGGEIILVVIGILFALQINSWKENSQNKATERAYLSGILNNLDQEIYELNELIAKDTIKHHFYSKLLKVFTDDSINVYSKDFIIAIGQSYVVNSFKGNDIIFEDMKSSGKINYIKSDVLRFSILEYYNESQGVISSQKEYYRPQMLKLRSEAFHDNIDMNSLIEKYMIPPGLDSEVDRLDLSFFESDPNSSEVKKFANRVSLMKVLLLSQNRTDIDLVEKAQRLKLKIAEYLSNEVVDDKNYIPIETLTAIRDGDIKQLKLLIPKASINYCVEANNETQNYLTISIFEGSMKSLKYFVETGIDLNLVCENKTPLMYAAKRGEIAMVKYLINEKADIDFVSVKGKTALDYAIQYKHPKIVTYLKSLNAKQVMTLKQ